MHAHYEGKGKAPEGEIMSSGETVTRMPQPTIIRLPSDDDEGYHPDSERYARDKVVDSEDEYTDSSDDDGGLQMVRRKSIAQGTGRSMSITNATLARYRERRETGGSVWSKKSSRSGSSNTIRKVRTRSHGEADAGVGLGRGGDGTRKLSTSPIIDE